MIHVLFPGALVLEARAINATHSVLLLHTSPDNGASWVSQYPEPLAQPTDDPDVARVTTFPSAAAEVVVTWYTGEFALALATDLAQEPVR